MAGTRSSLGHTVFPLLPFLALLAGSSGCWGQGSETPVDYHIIVETGGGNSAIAFDRDGSPHVVYVGGSDAAGGVVGPLNYAVQTSTGWSVEELPAVGAAPALAIDSAGTPHITFYAAGSAMTYLVRGTDGKWESFKLEDMGGSVTNYPINEVNHHLRVDAQDHLHLLYYNDVNPGRLVYGFKDASGWTLSDVASGVTTRNNWLDLNEDGEPFVGYWDVNRFKWARKDALGWNSHVLQLNNDQVTDQGEYCAMVVMGKDTVIARFWGVYRWKDSYGSSYADDVFIQAVTPDGGTVLLNNATLEPGELAYSPGPTVMYKNAAGGHASVSFRDGGLWGAFGGRIPINLGQWALSWSYNVDFPTGNEAAVWLGNDLKLHFEGPEIPVKTGAGGTRGDNDIVAAADGRGTPDVVAPSCELPEPGPTPVWQRVGDAPVSDSEAWQFDLAVDGQGPWVAYRDYAAGSKLTVKRYSACQWNVVGAAGISAGEINYPSLSLYDGKPWVAYTDLSRFERLFVKKYGGAGWSEVGGYMSTTWPANAVSLVVMNGLPYVAVTRSDQFYRPSVWRHNTVEWEPVGEEFLSDVGSESIDLMLWQGGLAVAFADGNKGNAATVKRYDPEAKSWKAVGAEGFSPGQMHHLRLASGVPGLWAAFADASAGDVLSVMKYDADAWTAVGAAGTPGEPVKWVSLVVGETAPFIASSTVDGKSSVVTYAADTGWTAVGNQGFQAIAEAPVLALGPDGTLYVAYSSGLDKDRLVVEAYR